MKCKYCNADIEQDAQFCTNCGKDLSKFNKCVKCGELLDDKTDFCPHCGTEQPHEVVFDEENVSSKKWIWAIVVVLLIALIGGGYYYLSQNRGSSSGMAGAVDSDSIAVVDTIEVTDMESLEKDLSAILFSVVSPSFELKDMHKYFTEGYINFYKRACDKADKEGCEHPRIWWQESESDPENYKINSIDIKSEDEAVAKVTVSGETMKVVFDVVVKRENGKWLIDTVVQLQDVDDLSNEADVEGVISLQDALEVAKCISSDEKKLSSLETVNSIMSKYGYKYEKKYYSIREYDFSPLYYKNCMFAQSIRDDEGFSYNGVPTAMGEGVSSFVGFDVLSGDLIISPFTKESYNNYIKATELLGGKKVDENVYKIGSYEICFFDNIAMMKYCISISKNN